MQYLPGPTCDAVPTTPHVVGVHTGLSHPGYAAAHVPVASSDVICAKARLLRALLSAAREGISACMSERGVAPAVRALRTSSTYAFHVAHY